MSPVEMASDFHALNRPPSADPDIQATLSDFLTYTEHFPSQLSRALTLIEDQCRRAEQRIQRVHHDTTTYSLLPFIKEGRPDPVQLRRDISYALEEAERACRMSVEEAARLDETCQHEARRLGIVIAKLRAQSLPPSRDPTPEQQVLTSPNLKKQGRLSRRAADDSQPEKPDRKLNDKAASKLRGRTVMVPGEVLPPPDPNAPVESMSDLTSPRRTPPPERSTAVDKDKEKQTTPRPSSRTPKPSRPDQDRTPKPRGPRAPGQPGTNAHSAVAGISTSNALLALKEPPDDAPKGSIWLPWMKLTEWEMAKLRKRMKKNAIWVPSHTMVRRELKTLGRGVAGKEAARVAAEAGGQPFVDEHTGNDPTKIVISGEESAQINELLGTENLYIDEGGEDADQELINRGMRLNEAKKLKRQRMLEEQALQAQIAREQGSENASEGDRKALGDPKPEKRRKRDITPPPSGPSGSLDSPDPLSRPGPALKKIKIAGGTALASESGTTKVPLAPEGVSSTSRPGATRTRQAATPPPQKSSLVLKADKAVSEEPPNRRASRRRSSNVSAQTSKSGHATKTTTSPRTAPKNPTTVSPRRSRRPAPGFLTSTDEDGGAKVGVSKRIAAPRKKSSAKAATSALTQHPDPAASTAEDYIDPTEPRYCLCGDVSWGIMIACDNDDCETEWFHLPCVDLTSRPPRRTKWYCPACRPKPKGRVGSVATGRK